MPQTLLEMAKDLVREQILNQTVPDGDVIALLNSTHATLMRLDQVQSPTLANAAFETQGEVRRADWRRSITRHSVTCLECGATFKQLSARHLSTHDLNPRSYRVKYGIPRAQALSAREVTARRRELAKEIRPWEQAHKRRKTATASRPNAKRTVAK